MLQDGQKSRNNAITTYKVEEEGKCGVSSFVRESVLVTIAVTVDMSVLR